MPYAPDTSLDALLLPAVMLLGGRRIAALTGAGLSTASGIPDYRGPGSNRNARPPMRIHMLLDDDEGYRRYWARSHQGWPTMRAAQPNVAHHALAQWEQRSTGSQLVGVVTQNVDRLHDKAGTRRRVELHGALAEVVCVDCGAHEPRDDVQQRMHQHNPMWRQADADLAHEVRPDGDVNVDEGHVRRFVPPHCMRCDGRLKPNVVFFGEHVERHKHGDAEGIVDDADALVVVGSTLAIPSASRLVRRMHNKGAPVVLVNLGPTLLTPAQQRDWVTLHLDASCTDVLPALVDALR